MLPKIKIQLHKVTRRIRKYTAYSSRLYRANFDTQDFIQSCYLGQQAFRRKEDEERTKELITFVICKIKDAMKTVEPQEK